MKVLPFLISIPHGGTQIPNELKSRTIINKADLFDDSDPFTNEIYNVGAAVQKVVKGDIYRAFVDLNRSENELPPEFPDGLIKSKTCYGKQIYKHGCEPDAVLRKKLISKYYTPYFNKLKTYTCQPEIKLAFDCHSMASTAPIIAPDPGKKRPMFCIGNVGNFLCDLFTTQILAESIQRIFELAKENVTINNPFKGGYITKRFGNNPIPWIQIEMNRELYLNHLHFERNSLKMNKKRLISLNELFRKVLYDFYGQLDWKI